MVWFGLVFRDTDNSSSSSSSFFFLISMINYRQSRQIFQHLCTCIWGFRIGINLLTCVIVTQNSDLLNNLGNSSVDFFKS